MEAVVADSMEEAVVTARRGILPGDVVEYRVVRLPAATCAVLAFGFVVGSFRLGALALMKGSTVLGPP